MCVGIDDNGQGTMASSALSWLRFLTLTGMPEARIIICVRIDDYESGTMASTMASTNLCWQTGQDFADRNFKTEISCNLVDFQAKNFTKSLPRIVMHVKPGLNSSEWLPERNKKTKTTENRKAMTA